MVAGATRGLFAFLYKRALASVIQLEFYHTVLATVHILLVSTSTPSLTAAASTFLESRPTCEPDHENAPPAGVTNPTPTLPPTPRPALRQAS
ncbi:hypothetical protein DFH07DRAFT_843758, partial [Mycena maculata]